MSCKDLCRSQGGMMRRFLLITLLILLVMPLFAGRKALVIGNSSYTDAPLKNPVNDANAISGLLSQLGFVTTVRTNLDRRCFEESIEQFASTLNSTDEAVFYYSGHGAQIEGENYLIPVGRVFQGETDVKYDAVSANKATEKISQRAGTSIIVLDACRDNPFRGSRSGTKGLAIMQTREGGQFIIYSTGSGQTADDGGSGSLSPFTDAFIRHAVIPDVTIEEMMRNVVKDVRAVSNNKQVPFYYGSMEDAFCFALSGQAPQPRPYTPPPLPIAPVTPDPAPALTPMPQVPAPASRPLPQLNSGSAEGNPSWWNTKMDKNFVFTYGFARKKSESTSVDAAKANALLSAAAYLEIYARDWLNETYKDTGIGDLSGLDGADKIFQAISTALYKGIQTGKSETRRNQDKQFETWIQLKIPISQITVLLGNNLVENQTFQHALQAECAKQ